MEVIIRQIFFHMLRNIASGKKRLQLHRDIASGIVDKRTDDRVIAGIFPVTDGSCIWLFLAVEKIIHYIPRTVDIRSTEVIAVIPRLDLRSPIKHISIQKKLFHVSLGKSKIFIQ